jgi:Fic family protein
VPEMTDALANLEQFLHQPGDIPALVHCAIAHSQFETIHPFLDGNGRVGRLLISFLLVHQQVQHRPLLYLSHYLKRHRATYYELLMAVRRDGDWQGWIRFFLQGVLWTARDATDTAQQIIRLREQDRDALIASGLGSNELRLLDLLFQRPLVNTALVADSLKISDVTARKLIGNLERLGVLEEITGKDRYRVYRYARYWKIFTERTDMEADQDEHDETLSAEMIDSLRTSWSSW